MRISLTLRAVAVTSVAALSPLASASIIIDQFNAVGGPNPWPSVSNSVGTVNVNESGLANVLGGNRATSITTDLIGVSGLDQVQVTVAPAALGTGVMDFASTLQASADLTLLYDAGTGNLNADFSNELGISMNFIAYDQGIGGSNQFRVTINDGANSASLLLNNTIEFGKVFFDFAAFANIGSVNLASINSVQVEFLHGANAVDFRLDVIETVTVPNPATLCLLALAVGAGRGRRRR